MFEAYNSKFLFNKFHFHFIQFPTSYLFYIIFSYIFSGTKQSFQATLNQN